VVDSMSTRARVSEKRSISFIEFSEGSARKEGAARKDLGTTTSQ
jgi:hypothetical protein